MSDRHGFVVAVDGGGSHTTAIVATTQGAVLGFGRGGPSNFLSVEATVATRSVLTAIERATADSGCTDPALASAAVCVAGVGLVPHSNAALKTMLASVPAAVVVDASDTDAAWTAAFPRGGSGVIAIAGTGAVVVGRGENGRRSQTGGWGHLIGDEGSGYWVGRHGIAAASRAHDGRAEPTLITATLTRRLGLESMDDLREAVYVRGLDRRGIADLAPAVFEASDAGDPTARQIVAEAAGELALAVEAAAEQLEAGDPVPVGLFGSLWQNRRLRDAFTSRLATRRVALPLDEPPLPALAGALILALRAGDFAVNETVLATIAETIRAPIANGD
jgi:N-acetylglucosamine kinase-like BadF-type ATPase